MTVEEKGSQSLLSWGKLFPFEQCAITIMNNEL